jgi:molybdopterin biosynthesis enzyme
MPIDAPSTNNGKIRDSNKIMLMSALQDLNIHYVVDGGTAKDELVFSFIIEYNNSAISIQVKHRLFKHYNPLLN